MAKKKGSLPELKQKAAAMLPGIGGVAKKKGLGPDHQTVTAGWSSAR